MTRVNFVAERKLKTALASEACACTGTVVSKVNVHLNALAQWGHLGTIYVMLKKDVISVAEIQEFIDGMLPEKTWNNFVLCDTDYWIGQFDYFRIWLGGRVCLFKHWNNDTSISTCQASKYYIDLYFIFQARFYDQCRNYRSVILF